MTSNWIQATVTKFSMCLKSPRGWWRCEPVVKTKHRQTKNVQCKNEISMFHIVPPGVIVINSNLLSLITILLCSFDYDNKCRNIMHMAAKAEWCHCFLVHHSKPIQVSWSGSYIETARSTQKEMWKSNSKLWTRLTHSMEFSC